MNHIGAIIDTCLIDSIPPLILALGGDLIDEVDFIIGANNILLDLLRHLLYILCGSRIQEFVYDCMILLPLAPLERN